MLLKKLKNLQTSPLNDVLREREKQHVASLFPCVAFLTFDDARCVFPLHGSHVAGYTTVDWVSNTRHKRRLIACQVQGQICNLTAKETGKQTGRR
jgi:hypothetical protein